MIARKDLTVKTLSYFHHFHTPLTLQQIHIFYPKAISLHSLEKHVKLLCKEKTLHKDFIDIDLYYTLGGIREIDRYKKARALSKEKTQRAQTYLSSLERVPVIQFIGLSGSLAMDSAKENDDIDLFIISADRRMWTARFFSIILAYIMGLKRRRGTRSDKDKVCLNLFFDGRDVSIPIEKRNAFVGHELLQMKPI